jgi:hypothetical protein
VVEYYAAHRIYLVVRNHNGYVDDELKVIEYNGFNSAGLYACDVGNVVDAINEYVEKEHGY